MKEAMLYEKLKGDRVKCHLCPWLCVIPKGGTGHCCVRRNINGTLYASTYAKITSQAVDPIEKKPLFHFHPGSLVYSLGTLGCNLRCIHCQNWQIAHAKPNQDEATSLADLLPESAVREARRGACAGIAWTYNEPTIWLEYTLESARLCRESGLYTAYVTNGYTTERALDLIAPHLDAYRVDVKGFTKGFYRNLSGISNHKPILDSAARAKNKWGCHVEIVTNIIPGWNDDDAQLRGLAAWITNDLGDKTPWHVTRFIPHLDLRDVPPTPIETLERAQQIGIEAGLKFVYIGNVPGHPGENTYCPRCGSLAIERRGFIITRYDVAEGKCAACGEGLAIVE